MKRSISRLLPALLLFLFCGALTAEITLSVKPAENHIEFEQTLVLEVWIAGVTAEQPLRGFELTLQYDNVYLTAEPEDIIEDGYLPSFALEHGTQFYAIGEDGSYMVSSSLLGAPLSSSDSPWGAYGEGVLFTIDIDSSDLCNCRVGTSVTISDIILRDEMNQPIYPDRVENATVFIHPRQLIPLYTGWNLVSTWIEPADLTLEGFFGDLIDNNLLVKVQDELGNALVKDIFGVWQNYIGDYDLQEGYYVKVDYDCFLDIYGCCLLLPMDVPLRAGWNIIPYPYSYAQPGLDVLADLIDSGLLVKAQDESGAAIVKNIFGIWENYIGDFYGGEAYYINVSADTSIHFPAPERNGAGSVGQPDRIMQTNKESNR